MEKETDAAITGASVELNGINKRDPFTIYEKEPVTDYIHKTNEDIWNLGSKFHKGISSELSGCRTTIRAVSSTDESGLVHFAIPHELELNLLEGLILVISSTASRYSVKHYELNYTRQMSILKDFRIRMLRLKPILPLVFSTEEVGDREPDEGIILKLSKI